MAKFPLCPEEMMLPYSKYYNWKLMDREPMQLELLREPMDPKDALAPEDLNELYKPGYLARECGYCVMPDGTGYGAAYVYMPGVTIEMIDWWYVWHFIRPQSVPEKAGNLRYKIWCPIEHWDTGFANEESRLRAIDESIPMRYRRYGAENFIYESLDGGVGNNRIMIAAKCFDPVDFGFDPKLVNIPENGTMIASSSVINGLSALNVYQFRPAYMGVEMRIRTYKGIDMVGDGKFVRDLNGHTVTPEEVKMGNYHCLLEYPHLARFLPSLYAEQGKKPVTED